MAMQKSCKFSINVLLVFDMCELISALFLTATSSGALSFSFEAAAKRYIILLQ